jgi:hypothetical protein
VLILLPIGIRRTPWLCSDHGGLALTAGFRTPGATRHYGDGYKPDTRVSLGSGDLPKRCLERYRAWTVAITPAKGTTRGMEEALQ